MAVPSFNGIPPVSTVPYCPDANDPPRVGGIAYPAPVSDREVVPLLHKRLRFLVLVFAAFYLAYVVIRFVHPGPTGIPLDIWASVVTVVIFLGLWAFLSSRRWLTLRQLRGIEFVVFVILASLVILRHIDLHWHFRVLDRVHDLIATKAGADRANAMQIVIGVSHRLMLFNSMVVVAYAVIIPNTWKRCAIVVAVFTALPMAAWVAAYFARDIPAEFWFSFGVSISALTAIQIAVLAAYGAHRIERSRREAAAARRLGQYVLRTKIGSGGMGEVYLADHVLLRRPCAIKLIRPERAGDPDSLRRFEREVQITATLTHPNTVQVFDYGHAADGTFYYVMEYLPGLTLDELVKRHGPLAPGRAAHLLRQVCAALCEAHARGLTHRDIKPGNVMACERGGVPDFVKVLDFGLVRVGKDAADATLTREGAVPGTPAYMSPEQAGGEGGVDPRSDLYSVGALAYFLLTGQPPFGGRSAAKMLAAHLYETPAALPADVPSDLAGVVMRCLAKSPIERWPDAASLESAFAEAAVPVWTAVDARAWWARAGSDCESGAAVATVTQAEPGSVLSSDNS